MNRLIVHPAAAGFPLVALMFTAPLVYTAHAEAPSTKSPKTVTVRLVNITIPPDSRLRNLDSIAKPPTLYLEVYENGALIGTSLTVGVGWDVDYPDKPKNRWVIKADAKTRYALKVMDDNWWSDDLVVEVTGCKGKDLQGVVRERGPASEAVDRLATIEFEVVTDETAEKK